VLVNEPAKGKDNKDTATTDRAERAERATECVIEVCSKTNQNVMFDPVKAVLRGKWSGDVLRGIGARQALAKLPDMPGIHIALDPQRKAARIFDPLALPTNRDLLARINEQYPSISETGKKGRPEDDKAYKDLSDTQIKTWATDMRRLVDAGLAVVVKGELWTETQIESWQGKTQIEAHRSGKLRYKEEPEPEPTYS